MFLLSKSKKPLGVLALSFALILVCSSILAGLVGLVVAAVYLFAIVVPGGILYLCLNARFNRGPKGFIETLFLSNVAGFALLQGCGWLLTRSSLYSLPATLLVEVAIVACAVLLARKELLGSCRAGIGSLLSVSGEEGLYFLIIAGVVLLVMTPVLLIYAHGFLIGGDTAVFTELGYRIATQGGWPDLSAVWYPYAPAGGAAPGMPVLYAVLASATNVVPITLAGPLAIIPVILSPLGMYVLIRRFARRSIAVYGLPIVWMLSPWMDQPLYFNSLFPAAFYGIFPDSLFGIPAYIATLILLVDLLNGKGSQWMEVCLLSLAMALTALDNQLDFFFLLPAIPLFWIETSWFRGIKWTTFRYVLSLLPTLILLPPYLEPHAAAAASPAISGGKLSVSMFTQFDWTILFTDSSPLGIYTVFEVVLVLLVGFALVTVTFRRLRKGKDAAGEGIPHGLFLLGLLGLVAVYLSASPVGSALLGINWTRFLEFVAIPLYPVLGIGFDFVLRWQNPQSLRSPSGDGASPAREPDAPTPSLPTARRRSANRVLGRIPGMLLLALVVSSTAMGAWSMSGTSQSAARPQNVFTPDLRAASEWLKVHAVPGSIFAADEMSGNSALEVIRDYSGHVVVSRPRFDLPVVLYGTPSPSNLSYFYENLVMTSPTYSNASAASQRMAMDYYIFQKGFSDQEIAAFSHLPYLPLVYSNPQVDVFEFAPGEPLGFVPAISYCQIDPSLTEVFSPMALDSPFGMPSSPNAISSVSPNGVDGVNVTYCLNVPRSGSYLLYVHRIVFKTSEYLVVGVNGTPEGSVYFPQSGAAYGTWLNLSLPAGPIRLSLTVEGTIRWVDPIDYLVIEHE
ncbi:MAG: hypothetical protein JRN35_10610 [Nitrososphaerota archaeon]|nr:hypothetical protein [Nitrososphaerota archaeon]